MKSLYTFLLVLFLSINLSSQTEFPQDYFIPPVKIPIYPSGTFGEWRTNHFHSGLDIRIGGKIGEPIYAVADGYVSRIRISSAGGGKMLYIDHPNGFRSVFFHLDSYEGEIGEYVRDYQYKNKKFEFEVFPQKNQLPVKKGQLVGKGGNTGSSGGPHLHYEIRLSYNDQTINPLLFGLKMTDNIAPTIKEVRVYMGDTNGFNGSHTTLSNLTKTVKQRIKDNDGKIKTVNRTVKVDTIRAFGSLYFGIDVTDKSLNSTNNIGVSSIKLYIDDSLFFYYNMQTFRFDQTRYINSMIDYPEFIKNRKRYLLTRVTLANKIHVIEKAENKGYFYCIDGGLHKFVYEVSDFSGNTAKRTFYIQSDSTAEKKCQERIFSEDYQWQKIDYSSTNQFSFDNFSFYAEKNVFFEDIYIRYKLIRDTLAKYYSDIYDLTQENPVPLFKSYNVKIKPNVQIPEYLKSKTIIARLDNKKLYSEGGEWNGEYLTMNTTQLAPFVITVDTISPQITPVNFSNKKTVQQVKLQLKIKDELSGIKNYNCYLNDEWILTEYDAKNNLLIIDSDKKIKKGNNHLKVIVTDKCNNQAIKEYTVWL